MQALNYLHQIIPLQWWVKEIQTNGDQHKVPGAIGLITAVAINYLWGSYSAWGFILTSATIYPHLNKQITYCMHLNASSTAQAICVVMIPFISSKIPCPKGFEIFLSLCLAYSIITKDWNMGSFMQQIKDEKDRYEKLNMVQQEKITRLTKVSQSLTDNFNALSRQHSSNHATSQYQSDLCFALEQIADVFKASTDNDSLKQVVRKTQSTLQQKQLQLAELQGNLLNYEEKLTIVKDQFEQAREAFNQINEKHARILDEQEKNLTFLQGIVNWLSPWITSLRSPKSSGS